MTFSPMSRVAQRLQSKRLKNPLKALQSPLHHLYNGWGSIVTGNGAESRGCDWIGGALCRNQCSCGKPGERNDKLSRRFSARVWSPSFGCVHSRQWADISFTFSDIGIIERGHVFDYPRWRGDGQAVALRGEHMDERRISDLSDSEVHDEITSLGFSLDADNQGRDPSVLREVLHSLATDYEPLLDD